MSEFKSPSRVVLRGSSGYVTAGLLAAVMLYLLVDAAARGAWHVVFVALPWLLAVGWLTWLVLVRPCVIVTPEGLTVANVFMTHKLPWTHIDDLRVRHQLTITLVDGRRVQAWGSPTSERSREATDRQSHSSKHPYIDVASVIEQLRSSFPEVREARQVTRHFAWFDYAVLCVIVIIGIVAALVS